MKIAIVGSASSSRDLAPFDQPDWDIWALAWRGIARATALFDMHDPLDWHHHGGPGYVNKLIERALPLYVRQPLEGIDHLVYPFDEVTADLTRDGKEPCDFFTSSLAIMLALAIHFKPDSIGLYGCDCSGTEEYAYQRPALLYLIGLARGRGINVIVPNESVLLKANFVYGSNYGGSATPRAVGLTPEYLKARLAKYERDRTESVQRMNDLSAGIRLIEHSMAELAAIIEKMGADEWLIARLAKYETDHAEMQKTANVTLTRINTLDGTIQELIQQIDMLQHFNRGGVLP